MKAGISAKTVAAVAALLCASACGSVAPAARPSASEVAADRARAAERSLRSALTGVATATPAPRGAALLRAASALAASTGDVRYRYGATLAGDGSVRLLVAFDGTAQTGGGLSYEQARARLCVRYRVTPGTVTVRDAGCSEALRRPTGATPKADEFVTLR